MQKSRRVWGAKGIGGAVAAGGCTGVRDLLLGLGSPGTAVPDIARPGAWAPFAIPLRCVCRAFPGNLAGLRSRLRGGEGADTPPARAPSVHPALHIPANGLCLVAPLVIPACTITN